MAPWGLVALANYIPFLLAEANRDHRQSWASLAPSALKLSVLLPSTALPIFEPALRGDTSPASIDCTAWCAELPVFANGDRR